MTAIVFLDLETTGLDPVKDHVLQIAIQVVDADTLKELGEPFVSDVALTEAAAGRLYTNPYVRDMHTKTGLLGRLEADVAQRGAYSAELAELRACTYLGPLVRAADGVLLTLAGNSVHFDLAFLRTHMPRLASKFSHRLLDVSTLGLFETRWGSGKISVENTNEHDALADVRSSIEQLRRYVARREDLAAAFAVRDQIRD